VVVVVVVVVVVLVVMLVINQWIWLPDCLPAYRYSRCLAPVLDMCNHDPEVRETPCSHVRVHGRWGARGNRPERLIYVGWWCVVQVAESLDDLLYYDDSKDVIVYRALKGVSQGHQCCLVYGPYSNAKLLYR